MGVGIGIGPNGQIGPVITFDSGSSSPSSYDSHFETPEGITVSMTFDTDNKALADAYEADVARSLSWKIVDKPESPSTRAGDMFLAAFLGAAIGFVAFVVGIFCVMILNVTDLLPSVEGYYNSSVYYGKIVVKSAVGLGVFAAILLPIVVGITWKPDSPAK
jgi:hypothetical protein